MGISEKEFEYVCQVLRTDAAIVLEKGKEYLVEARLSPLARSAGMESLDEFVAQVRREAPNGELRRKIVDALTTNETSFFRDKEPFEILRSTIIPEIILKRKEQRVLRIWCAASSTGQEPYSLAMLIREHFPQLSGWNVEILATDLCRDVLDRARRGVYSQLEVNRGLPAVYLVKYFEKNGAEWRIKEDVRAMVKFSELNLLHPFSIIKDVDIVMMRNVLIYFDVETKRAIFAKVRGVLKHDGALFLGAAETTYNIDDRFERRTVGKASCYQKKT